MKQRAYDPALAPSPSAPLAVPSDLIAGARARWDLTRRQSEMVALAARGLANKEIACLLDCSVGNVEQHLTTIFRKAGVTSRTCLLVHFWTGR